MGLKNRVCALYIIYFVDGACALGVDQLVSTSILYFQIVCRIFSRYSSRNSVGDSGGGISSDKGISKVTSTGCVVCSLLSRSNLQGQSCRSILEGNQKE